MSAPTVIDVQRRRPAEYGELTKALRQCWRGVAESPAICEAVVAEIGAQRDFIAAPLEPANASIPVEADRAQLAGKDSVTLNVTFEGAGDGDTTTIGLNREYVEAALYVGDQLHINAFDAVILLHDALPRQQWRADRNGIAAALDLHRVRRREAVLFLQEILRASLAREESEQGRAFVAMLVRERDALVTQCNVIARILARIKAALVALQNNNTDKTNALPPEELVLIAEALFLLAYTVQFSTTDAVALRALIDSVGALYKKECEASEEAANKAVVNYGVTTTTPVNVADERSELRIGLESTRNLLALSWMCVLDRTRYENKYDARSGVAGINKLLQDDAFVRQTSTLGEMDDSLLPPVVGMDLAVLTSELVGAVFRLAVAVPDETEASQVALWVTAFGGCLSYLADELPEWIEHGAGSLTQDADLFADVLEDLALDLVETPLTNDFINWHHTEISHIAQTTVRDDFQQKINESPRFNDINTPARSNAIRTPASSFHPRTPANAFGATTPYKPQTPASPFAPTTPASPFQASPFAPTTPGSAFRPTTPASSFGGATPAGVTPRLPSAATTPGGKPPLPPSRLSVPPLTGIASETPRHGLLSVRGMTPAAKDATAGADAGAVNEDEDPNSRFCLRNNLASQLARFVARALQLAPHKLERDSKFSGPRYWIGSEGPGAGFINKISDSFTDLYEIRQNYAEGGRGVGTAFHEVARDFLALLAASVGEKNSVHAAQALRFLLNAGDATMSMNFLKLGLDGGVDQIVNRPSSRAGASVDRQFLFGETEAALIAGLVDVVAAGAKGLRDQGGLNAFVAGLGSDLANKISNLACYNINLGLKKSLINALVALDDHRATANFLVRAAENRSKSIIHYNAAVEGELGIYDVSIATLRLAESAASWREEEYPSDAIESIAIHFAMDKVLHEWSRRKYESEADRWALVGATASFLIALGLRDEKANRLRMLKIMTRLLTPAPGTGAASTALRALFSAAGLLRNSDFSSTSMDVTMNGTGQQAPPAQPPTEYHLAWGQDLLVRTANRGLGHAYREMVQAVISCTKVISGLFTISSSEAAGRGLIAANAADLLMVEFNSIMALASLVFHLDAANIAAYKYGYSSVACSVVISLLAVATRRNLKIAEILARNDDPSKFKGESFRSALSNILIDACSGDMEMESNNFEADPIMIAALHLVESCLGRDGGSYPGLYLLGLKLDASGRFCTAEIGILNALLEIVVEPEGFLDSAGRASAAVFVQRLAANTVRKTSYAVLEHVKSYGETLSRTRGAGVADEMLFKVLNYVNQHSVIASGSSKQPDWNSIAQLATSCMGLSALQIRLFPAETRSVVVVGEEVDSAPIDSAPSPFELYRAICQMAVAGVAEKGIVFEALQAWYFLLGERATIDAQNDSFAAVSVYFLLTNEILLTLASPRAGPDNEHAAILRKDGGYIAASAVLSCVQYICAWESRGNNIVDAQVANLLVGTVSAAAGLTGSALDSSRARMVLYSVLLKLAPLARKFVTEESIARAFGGRVGARQVSGTEAFLTVCCDDAVNSSSVATKAVAITAATSVVLMDPTRAVPSLNTQSRLRRIVESALGRAENRALIIKSCTRTDFEYNSSDPHAVQERQAMAIADAAITLVKTVSTVPNGPRAVVDAGAMDALAGLLQDLDQARIETFEPDTRDESTIGAAGRKASFLASIMDALASTISHPDATLIAAANEALEKSRSCFVDSLRHFRGGHPAALDATAGCAAVLSRIPQELLHKEGAPAQLRTHLAAALHIFTGNEARIGSGFVERSPADEVELADARTTHPINGTLFQRAEAERYIRTCHAIVAALRSAGDVPLFRPTLISDSNAGTLSDVLRLCRAALADVARYAEDTKHLRVLAEQDLNDKRDAIAALAERRYNLTLSPHQIPDSALADCLRKEAMLMRGIADRCLAVFEGALCILRDYVRAAKGATMGTGPLGGADKQPLMDAVQGQVLLNEAKEVLLPFCKEVDGIGIATWGGKDASFCKQVARAIRTTIVR